MTIEQHASESNVFITSLSFHLFQTDCPSENLCLCPTNNDQCEDYAYTFNFNHLVSKNTHIGLHNRNYFLTANVTNQAELSSTARMEFLVDESPPVTGGVMDGADGIPDVDFTQDKVASTYWRGFYDHESGIKFYKYAIANRCLTVDEMLGNETEVVGAVVDTMGNTTDTFFSGLNINITRYNVTVIAYNNAMEPSRPGCSDGVIVDSTPPIISEVFINGVSLKPGIACFKNMQYIVWANRTKQALNSSASGYDNSCTNVVQLGLIPTRRVVMSISASEKVLTNYYLNQTFDPSNKPYIVRDSMDISWQYSEDESQINDFKVGFSSNAANVLNPDIIGYQTTKTQASYKHIHTAFGHGSTVFIALKATNKARLDTTTMIGPIVFDQTPPDFRGTISVVIQPAYVVVHWASDTFVDDEGALIENFEVAIGRYFLN